MKTQEFISTITSKYPNQPAFTQAVVEFANSIIPYLENIGASKDDFAMLERLAVPERIITFKVIWEDDNGDKQLNTGYRVQFNSAIGPYKGGLRLDPSVNLDILKFLGFEQIFKNSLTGLPMGGGKGGSDFNPKGKSDKEVMRFCRAFMTELYKYIGPRTDVPAGDIGVGGREIGFLYGQYKKLANETTGVLTGKGMSYGGSNIRPEATGYGAVYFAEHILKHAGDFMTDKTAVVSGSGNVAQYASEKLMQKGVKVLSVSDRGGVLHMPNGMTKEILESVKATKANHKGLKDVADSFSLQYDTSRAWNIPADLYFPCATQNELQKEDAEMIVKNGGKLVCEGANMPTTLDAIEVFRDAKTLFGPAKAANAGGVGVSGLEMSQNAQQLQWTTEEVDSKLKGIMEDIHSNCVKYGTKADGSIDYIDGANIAGFVKVFNAMQAFGW